MAERVNEANATFNQGRELFGLNETELDNNPRRIVRRIADPSASPTYVYPSNGSGRVQQHIGAVASDVTKTATSVDVPEEDRTQMSGSFSLVRAARTLHQYDVDFWSPTGVVGYMTRSPVGAPSDAELDEKYNDLLAFSYMPGNMLPTATAFRELANPQARQAVVLAALPKAGVSVATRSDGLIGQTELGGDEVNAEIPPPFAENLQNSCAERSFFARSSGPLYTSTRSIS